MLFNSTGYEFNYFFNASTTEFKDFDSWVIRPKIELFIFFNSIGYELNYFFNASIIEFKDFDSILLSSLIEFWIFTISFVNYPVLN